MSALVQIIRQPVILLFVLWSYSSEYFGIDSKAVAFALSAQSQLGRAHLHHAVRSSDAFCTRKVGGLPMTKSPSCHRLYSNNIRLTASSSSHDDNAAKCTIDVALFDIS